MLTMARHFINTYSKNLLFNWKVIAQIMKEETWWIKDRLNPQANALLTQQQIDDALNGPLQLFFKTQLEAYGKITKIDTALSVTKEDSFKEFEGDVEKTFDLTKPFLDKTESDALQTLRNKLNALTKEQYAAWQTKMKDWATQILSHLNTDVLKKQLHQENMFTDTETNEFLSNQPLSEINHQFVEFHISMPKLRANESDCQQYFILKITIAVHSALSRLQQPHSEKEIQGVLKSLKMILNGIAEEEKTLHATQKNAVNALMAELA